MGSRARLLRGLDDAASLPPVLLCIPNSLSELRRLPRQRTIFWGTLTAQLGKPAARERAANLILTRTRVTGDHPLVISPRVIC
jgi:hypothetical protein